MPKPEAWALDRGSAHYPAGLADLDAARREGGRTEGSPARLYGWGARGAVACLEPKRAVTVVGARRATAYGRRAAHELGSALAAAGLTVVSGMAFGIDTAAHRGALEAGGVTVAVLAGGPDVAYPPSAVGLHARIAEDGGACVSEWEPGTEPVTWRFPARNRLMAALTAMTVVVEATERSGTRHTVDAAQRLGREVGAVPGPIQSRLQAFPHALIREGAILVRNAQDVLDEVLGVGAAAAQRIGAGLQPELLAVLDLVGVGNDTAEAVTSASRLDAAAVAVALARLELLGYLLVREGRYAPTGLVPPARV